MMGIEIYIKIENNITTENFKNNDVTDGWIVSDTKVTVETMTNGR